MDRPIVVLFVDDEIYKRKLDDHVQELEERGFDLIRAGDSDAAMERFVKDESDVIADFDLLVLDMGMPLPKDPSNVSKLPAGYTDQDRTGAYLLELFRSWNSHVKVLLYSQLTEEQVVEPAWEAFTAVCLSAGTQIPTLPTDAELVRNAKIEILSQQFQTTIAWKREQGPVDLANLVEKLTANIK